MITFIVIVLVILFLYWLFFRDVPPKERPACPYPELEWQIRKTNKGTYEVFLRQWLFDNEYGWFDREITDSHAFFTSEGNAFQFMKDFDHNRQDYRFTSLDSWIDRQIDKKTAEVN